MQFLYCYTLETLALENCYNAYCTIYLSLEHKDTLMYYTMQSAYDRFYLFSLPHVMNDDSVFGWLQEYMTTSDCCNYLHHVMMAQWLTCPPLMQ